MAASHNIVLVIAAHPDDETIGMGGTIHKLIQRGDEVHILFLSTGVGSRDCDREDADSRLSAAKRALILLGCERIYYGNFPDNAFDSVELLVVAKFIENIVNKIKPGLVFTNFHGDLNTDHRITAEATLVAARPKPSSTIDELYFYEVLSSTGWKFGGKSFSPNYFVDITKSISVKEAALQQYKTEMDESPNARSYESVTALARHRGNFIGVHYAEAFEIAFIRKVERP